MNGTVNALYRIRMENLLGQYQKFIRFPIPFYGSKYTQFIFSANFEHKIFIKYNFNIFRLRIFMEVSPIWYFQNSKSKKYLWNLLVRNRSGDEKLKGFGGTNRHPVLIYSRTRNEMAGFLEDRIKFIYSYEHTVQHFKN